MVKGPCRGKMCDFWARIKIRKSDVTTLVQQIQSSIPRCDGGSNVRQALDEFWSDFGVKDMARLCIEEPDLCEKIREAESTILKN